MAFPLLKQHKEEYSNIKKAQWEWRMKSNAIHGGGFGQIQNAPEQ